MQAEPGVPSRPLMHLLRSRLLPALLSGLGGALAIWTLAALTRRMDAVLLIAPFGASCVLLFALPHSPLACPRNVIGGHVLSALIGLLVLNTMGSGVLACGAGVGLAIAVMQLTGTLHPPAGGNPLVVIMTGAGWSFLATPVLAGALFLVLAAELHHRLLSSRDWPSARTSPRRGAIRNVLARRVATSVKN